MTERDHTKEFRAVIVGLTVVTIVSLLLSAWALYSRFTQTNANRAANQRVWHAVICAIEVQVSKSPTLTPAKKQVAYRFYDRLLTEDVETTGCGLR